MCVMDEVSLKYIFIWIYPTNYGYIILCALQTSIDKRHFKPELLNWITPYNQFDSAKLCVKCERTFGCYRFSMDLCFLLSLSSLFTILCVRDWVNVLWKFHILFEVWNDDSPFVSNENQTTVLRSFNRKPKHERKNRLDTISSWNME